MHPLLAVEGKINYRLPLAGGRVVSGIVWHLGQFAAPFLYQIKLVRRVSGDLKVSNVPFLLLEKLVLLKIEDLVPEVTSIQYREELKISSTARGPVVPKYRAETKMSGCADVVVKIGAF